MWAFLIIPQQPGIGEDIRTVANHIIAVVPEGQHTQTKTQLCRNTRGNVVSANFSLVMQQTVWRLRRRMAALTFDRLRQNQHSRSLSVVLIPALKPCSSVPVVNTLDSDWVIYKGAWTFEHILLPHILCVCRRRMSREKVQKDFPTSWNICSHFLSGGKMRSLILLLSYFSDKHKVMASSYFCLSVHI